MGKNDKQLLFYEYLKKRAATGESFTQNDVCTAIGWKPRSVKSYFRKQIQDFLAEEQGNYTVDSRFKRLSRKEFLSLVTQKRKVFPNYERFQFNSILTYEFLLPLTKEDKLRDSLDDLFYEDSLLRRIDEIGIQTLKIDLPPLKGESDKKYSKRIVKMVSSSLGGYSISHVAGRFRAGEIISRKEASTRLSEYEKYLVDETTASVKFILPVSASQINHGTKFRLRKFEPDDLVSVENEVRAIRALFFHFFVEAVVHTFTGEDEVWLIETSDRQRLYKWRSRDI